MAGLKQIMEIFMTINQPLSSEQRVRWYIQREPIAIHENNAEKESEGRGAGQGDGRRWAGTHQRQQRNHAIPGPLKFLQYLRGLL